MSAAILVVEHHADGGSRADKFIRDAKLLRRDLDENPDNSRAVFYLAQTMRDMGDTTEAIALYERRAVMGGWEEEVYFSLLQVGFLRAESGDWPGAMDALVRAWQVPPERLEACYELTCRLRLQGSYQAAHCIAAVGIDRAQPGDILFVQPWIYRWGMLFEYSITAYWTGQAPASIAACDRLLAMPELPPGYRQQTLANRDAGVRLLRTTPQPRVSA